MRERVPLVVAVVVWVLCMAGCLAVWAGYTVARDPGDPIVFAVLSGAAAVTAYGLTLGALRLLRRA